MHVHRSNRLEPLVSRLAELCATPGLAPTDPEVIVVQSKGMDRWLSMELSRRLGVFANARFPFPRKFIEGSFAAVLGGAPDASASFSPERMVWAIAALLPGLAPDPAFADLQGYLQGDARSVRRIEIAARLADVFDQYPVYRPESVLHWDEGESLEWQAALWRALVDRDRANHPEHDAAAHLARRAHDAIEAYKQLTSRPAALPRRVSIFGIDSLPPLFVDVFAALAQHIEVHLFLVSPSRAYWAEIRTQREIARSRGGREADAEELALTVGNPLLASLGRIGRDFQFVLEDRVVYREDDRDLYVEPGDGSMLATLQSDVLALHHRHAGSEDAAPRAIDPGDRSITIHACHGPMREVEVLRDQLLAMLHEEPGLEPRDIVVMTPDLATYAPLFEAVLGVDPRDPGHVPYRIADRGLRAESAAADAFLALLDLATSRMTAGAVIELLAREPVRARFAIDEAELTTIRGWVTDANVRWGVDAAHRKSFDQPAFKETTWRFGLDRLLLGYAMPGEDRVLFQDTLPFDDIEGSSAPVLGRFADFCEALFEVQRALAAPRPIGAFRDALLAALGRMIAEPEAQPATLQAIRDALRTMAEDAALGGFDEAVPIDIVRSRLRSQLEAPGGAAAFLAGGVTVCALLPMRSIPFRAVCLLGMNDGTFPRAARPPSFDLVAAHPRRGDRSLRNEDRYLFLEAILSARSRLVITYVGQSAHENAEIPPSVVVSELLDVIDESFAAAAPGRARDHVLVRHPLQPFSAAYFRGDRDPRLFSYAPRFYEGAVALLGPRTAAPTFFPKRLPPPEPRATAITLDELASFFINPMRALLESRLGVRLGADEEALEGREPMELDALDRHKLGADLVRRALTGEDLGEAYACMRARGVLPLGAMGRVDYDGMLPRVDALATAVRAHTAGEPAPPRELDVFLGETRLTGWVRDLWPEARVEHRFASVKASDELRLWIRHLALQLAARPGDPRDSVFIGLKDDAARVVRFKELGLEPAHATLAALLRLYHLGQTLPLCFFPTASLAYAKAKAAGKDDEAAAHAARAPFTGGSFGKGPPAESEDPYVARVLAERDPIEPGFRLLGPPAPGEEPEPSFAELALLIFGPLLDHREEA